MADSRLIQILRSGVENWNNWRRNNYVEEPDLSGEDLSGFDFTGADLSGAIFDDCRLNNTNFTNAILHSARFVNADITEANFSQANIFHAVLSESRGRDTANFTGSIDENTPQ